MPGVLYKVYTGESENPNDYSDLCINDIPSRFLKQRVWRPKEIQSRIPKITTRQIADLAEKGIVTPTEETSGAGTPRTYDLEAVYGIAIALSIRKIAPPEMIKSVVKRLIGLEAIDKGPHRPFFAKISFSQTRDSYSMSVHYQKNDPNIWDQCFSLIRDRSPQSYVDVVINIHDMKFNLLRDF